MLIFVKLGGSLITDKTKRYAVRRSILARLAGEISAALTESPDLQLVIGHGSGSFGHVAAHDAGYNPADGHPSPDAFAAVGAAAGDLNAIVRRALVDAGVPAVSLAPSALAYAHNGDIESLTVIPFERLLNWGGIPLTFGDVALTADGGTIVSTEAVLAYLARQLTPDRILLLGEVDGVFAENPHRTDTTATPRLLREITPATWPTVRAGLAGARGIDVTGGMVDKVSQMLALLDTLPALEIIIASGLEHGLLHRALSGKSVRGTILHRWPR